MRYPIPSTASGTALLIVARTCSSFGRTASGCAAIYSSTDFGMLCFIASFYVSASLWPPISPALPSTPPVFGGAEFGRVVGHSDISQKRRSGKRGLSGSISKQRFHLFFDLFLRRAIGRCGECGGEGLARLRDITSG